MWGNERGRSQTRILQQAEAPSIRTSRPSGRTVAAHLAILMPQKRPTVPQKVPNRVIELQAL